MTTMGSRSHLWWNDGYEGPHPHREFNTCSSASCLAVQNTTITQLSNNCPECTVIKVGLAWPTPSIKKISRGFGNQIHPINKVMKFHAGIDIGAPKMTEVVTAHDGKVMLSRMTTKGYGQMNVINSQVKLDGQYMATYYCHLFEDSNLVNYQIWYQRSKLLQG